MKKGRWFLAGLLALTCTPCRAEDTGNLARFLLDNASTDKGLCLVLGDGLGQLTAALVKESAGGLYVQESTLLEQNIAPGRQYLEGEGVLEHASIVLREVDFIPYADGLLNMVVVPDWEAQALSAGEVARVLAPAGEAFLHTNGDTTALVSACTNAGLANVQILPRPGWVYGIKPAPAGLGSWTHILAGADQSRVGDDTVVAPWEEIRWMGDPRWGSLYISYGAVVSAGGRLYYKENRRLNGRDDQAYLLARDAYNGYILWKHYVGAVGPYYTDYTLCCDEERVYLVEQGSLQALDGRTGQVVRQYSPGFTPKTVTVCGDYLIASAGSSCAILDKATGEVKWTGSSHAHPAACGGTAYGVYQAELFALDMATANELWRSQVEGLPASPPSSLVITVMHKAGVAYVVSAEKYQDQGQVAAFDAADGSHLWTQAGKFSHGVLPFDGEVWCLNRAKDANGAYRMYALVLDARTGATKRDFVIEGEVMGKCWPARASVNYIMYSNGWYVERATGQSVAVKDTRSPCRLGQTPANGLTYFLPHHCDCEVTFRGLLALSRPGGVQWLTDPEQDGDPRLFYTGGANPSGTEGTDDWPMYRHDPARSNSTDTNLPEQLNLLWTRQLGSGHLTQATAAYGMVYTAERDAHRVIACDAATGATAWTFVADGRVEFPPALSGGRCLFGTSAGSVYCLDAHSGKEIWRLRAAPVQKFVGDRCQLGSPWPIAGDILVIEGKAYFCVGRSKCQKGGLRVLRVDVASGQVEWRKEPAVALSGDMLRWDGSRLVYIRRGYRPDDFGLDYNWKLPSQGLLCTTQYYTPVSIVDYMATVEPSLSNQKHDALTDGRIRGDCLAFNAEYSVAGWRCVHGAPGYPADKGKFLMHAAGNASWLKMDTNQHIMGIVLRGDRAYAVGRAASYAPGEESELWVLSAATGDRLQTLSFAATPSYDGLSAAGGRLYLATENGELMCFGGTPQEDTDPPALTVTAAELSGKLADASPVTLRADGVPLTVQADGSFTTTLQLASLPRTLTLEAEDAGGAGTVVQVGISSP